MSLKLVVCWICLWITITDVSANYVVSNESITWQYASRRDNFATPKIQVDKSSFTVNITSILNEKEETWVGYYMKETAFAYIGCGRIDNKQHEVLLPVSRNSPGLCYSMCNMSSQKYIGLNKGKCFCMSKKPNGSIHQPECNITLNGTWMTDGGDGYMSIYEREKEMNVSSIYGNGKCLAFEQNAAKRINWSVCTEPIHALCKKGSNIFTARYKGQTHYGWQYYVRTCFKNDSWPITFNDIINLTIGQASGPSWSNVIQNDVIFKYQDFSNSTTDGNVIKYGYITKSGNNTVLTFTENKTNKKRRFLLKTCPVIKPTSDKSLTPTTNPRSQEYMTDNISKSTPAAVSQTTLTSEINHTPINRTQGFELKADQSDSENSDVGVVVSISLVIVVIVAVVVILIILKRRGKIPSICIKIPALDKSLNRTSDRFPTKHNENVESQETAYAQIDEPNANNNVDVRKDFELSNGHYAHTYFVLESGTRESNTDADISDSTNDNTEINDDYNTLHETVNAGTKGNDTYDTTEKAALKLKELQRAEDKEESPKMLNETKEDTYNRIDRSPLKNSKTDNIYGIPNSLENDYGDVGKTREKNLQDVDDTYNHVKPNQ